jgi:hypothetical protein
MESFGLFKYIFGGRLLRFVSPFVKGLGIRTKKYGYICFGQHRSKREGSIELDVKWFLYFSPDGYVNHSTALHGKIFSERAKTCANLRKTHLGHNYDVKMYKGYLPYLERLGISDLTDNRKIYIAYNED